ncbi:MAG TPA: hypothetical protein VM934_12755 [Pyrinomonadaceae bacterium]|nr:hypothetical protein [Pyrinomonadaceae bacterium]
MPFALLLALVAVASGTLATYLYDRDATFPARLCTGVCTGLAALGLVGFVVASWVGLTPLSLVVSGALVSSPLLLLSRREWRVRVRADVAKTSGVVRQAVSRPGRGATGTLIFYVAAALLFWFVMGHAMYVSDGGIFTGVDNNLGDLPFHISIISGFTQGENFPPQHTEYAGVRLTYPFLVDFLAAMFVRAGASLEGTLFWQGFVLALSLTGLLHRWALKLTGDRVAALMTPAIVLLSGGFGWWTLFGEATGSGRGLFELLGDLPHDYTIMSHIGYRWGNAFTALLIPQRGMLLGIPLALVVWTLWWQANEAESDADKGEGEGNEIEVAGDVVGRKTRKSSKRAARSHGRHATSGSVSPQTFLSLPFSFLPAVSAPVRMMIAAGVLAGLLPLVHAHSLLVMLAMGGCLAWRTVFKSLEAWGVSIVAALIVPLGFVVAGVAGAPSLARYAWFLVLLVSLLACVTWPRLYRGWRPWAAFFAVALVLAAPQMFWATRESGMRAGQFFGWEFGWDHGEYNPFLFWIKNTGLFIPLLVSALVWRGRAGIVGGRLLYFYLPFVLCFVVPNVYRLSPWVWDNIKVLYYWWIASAPLVALLLARLWRRGVLWRAVAVSFLVALTLAGGLDVWRVASGASEQKIFDRDGAALAELIRRETRPRSLILSAPTYNDPVYLTGRRKFIGYTGHLGSHGLDYAQREADMKRIYTGRYDAAELIAKYGIEYVVTGPQVSAELQKSGLRVDESFLGRYTKVGEAGAFSLYKTTRP